MSGGRKLQSNPGPLVPVERRDNVTAVESIRHRSREDRLRVWIALGGTEQEFDSIYPREAGPKGDPNDE